MKNNFFFTPDKDLLTQNDQKMEPVNQDHTVEIGSETEKSDPCDSLHPDPEKQVEEREAAPRGKNGDSTDEGKEAELSQASTETAASQESRFTTKSAAENTDIYSETEVRVTGESGEKLPEINTDDSTCDSLAETSGLPWQDNFLDLLSTHFLICVPMIQDKGEDCGIEHYHEKAGIIGVFDGCGGLGARVCPGMQGKTEAYLAGRAVGAAAEAWFLTSGNEENGWKIEDLRIKILDYLKFYKQKGGNSGSSLLGSLFRSFPSTAAAVVFRRHDDKMESMHIWAGDSRTYLLDSCGLAQISEDDIDGEDAYSNLKNDGPLTNLISEDGRFDLHSKILIPKSPCLIMAASDGAFGYLTSPMAFEELILAALQKASNVVQWQQSLQEAISFYAGDDQTLAVAAFGFPTFQSLKDYFRDRSQQISEIVEQFEQVDEEERLNLWNAYKPGYYRYSTMEV